MVRSAPMVAIAAALSEETAVVFWSDVHVASAMSMLH